MMEHLSGKAPHMGNSQCKPATIVYQQKIEYLRFLLIINLGVSNSQRYQASEKYQHTLDLLQAGR